MRRTSIVPCLIALGLPWLALGLAQKARADDQATIAWHDDLERAVAEARSSNRLVWVQFTGPWCHNCTRMEREAFSHPSVIAQAGANFVPVKLRADLHEELALSFGLSQLPATVILRPSREVASAVQGYMGPDTLVSHLKAQLQREGRQASTPAPDARLALAGYCAVNLVDVKKLVSGKSEFSTEHDGRTYRFASSSHRESFRKSPERYVPVNGGRCPIAQVDRGESLAGVPQFGVLHDGHLYLCADEIGRALFLRAPDRYMHVDVADRGFCPHCRAREGLLVRGRPEYSLRKDGRRYFFPDAEHLAAFRDHDDVTRR